MTAFIKVDGAWVPADRLHYHVNGGWAPVQKGYVRRSGVWTKFYELDITPPPSPQIDLTIIETKYGQNNQNKGRHIRVVVSLPGPDQAATTKLIRVLTTYQGKQPTTQFGGTYTAQPDANHPDEPWSDWTYKPDGVHNTTQGQYKTWPRSATDSSKLTDGERYYFSGWTLDRAGNWSAPTHTSIVAPKDGGGSNILHKETRFQPNWAGTMTSSGSFTIGQMTQQGNPLRRGVIGYGNKVENEIGSQGPATIKTAQIKLARTNDNGSASANIYIAYHAHLNYGSPDPDGHPWNTWSEARKLGTLSKGESKWFDIPSNFHDNLVKYVSGSIGNFRGFVLLEKDPSHAAAQADDFSVLKSQAELSTQGELHVTWTEEL